MTECTTYTGDIGIRLDPDTDWDLLYTNGQPCMTDGFATAVMLSVFGEPDFWQNGITNDPNQKFISTFPSIIRQATVTQQTLRNGVESIKRALQWMLDISACESIEVTGSILNVYAIGWQIDIIKGNVASRYEVNWEKGVKVAFSIAA